MRLRPERLPATPEGVAQAAAALCRGELVAFPTETVFGLGADATQPDAVRQIFTAKGRPADHPVIVHVAPDADLSRWAARVPPLAERAITAFWPGPLTLILPRAAGVSDLITGGQDTVGLRAPSHPVALALLRAFVAAGGSGAIVAPSANRFGRISPTCAEHVEDELAGRLDWVLDGAASEVGIESTILDLSRERPVLLRPGGISLQTLADALGEPVWLPDGQSSATPQPRVSGSLSAHYAPRTPLALVAPEALSAALARHAGQSVAVYAQTPAPATLAADVRWHQAPGEPQDYARELYAALRRLDAAGHDQLLVTALPETPAWLAVRDRLQRAATGSGEG